MNDPRRNEQLIRIWALIMFGTAMAYIVGITAARLL